MTDSTTRTAAADSTAAPHATTGEESRRASRPHLSPNASSASSGPALPPIVTAIGARRISGVRVPSWSGRRASTFSTTSVVRASRPQSVVFPAFHSSLAYALVRDFAYTNDDPMHYGPPPEPLSPPSSTPGSEFPLRRLSDTQFIIPHATSRTAWSGHPDSLDASKYSGPQLPAVAYGDGPPWREDEDLLSPIVTSTRHRKTRSDMDYFSSRSRDASAGAGGPRRASYASINQDGSQSFYFDNGDEGMADGPGGEIVTLPPDPGYRDSVVAHDSSYGLDESPGESPEYSEADAHRYSRDYSFSIASPDEEMHGKAIALFDFESENDNELPLIEGQVLWVSYRHGEGWLVAKDPATGEDGLVPEAYVRLEREIQGGFGQLNVHLAPDGEPSPDATGTVPGITTTGSAHSSGAHYPVVSHFSTSSKDLLPQSARTSSATTPAATATHVENPMGTLHLDDVRRDSRKGSATETTNVR